MIQLDAVKYYVNWSEFRWQRSHLRAHPDGNFPSSASVQLTHMPLTVASTEILLRASERRLDRTRRSHILLGVLGAGGGEGSSGTLQTVIREGESIIHGEGGLMYRGDCQTDTTVSDTRPAASYPLASTQHNARESAHTTHERSRGNKRRVVEKVRRVGRVSFGRTTGCSNRVPRPRP